MKLSLLTASALLLTSPATGQNAPRNSPPCLSKDQASAFVSYVMPTYLERVAGRCRSALPADAFLHRTDGLTTLARFNSEKEAQWPTAKQAMLRLGGNAVPVTLSDTTLKGLLNEGIVSDLAAKFEVKDCAAIDDLARGLAPLPLRNIGEVVSAILVFSSAEKGTSLVICKPGRP